MTAYKRPPSSFREMIGTDGDAEFPPEAGRYHLYGSLACPWVHRVVIVRHLKGLEDVIGFTPLDPVRGEDGWRFAADRPDPLNNWTLLSEAYIATDSHFDGRVTGPVLWDKVTRRIINNESSDQMRMLDDAFGPFGNPASQPLYPEDLRDEIDAINEWVYTDVNDGVYRVGFAKSQADYDRAVQILFEALERLEGLLADQRYLVGEQITLADWRLFTTLVRFDLVYVEHFKCNLRRISEYPNLSRHLWELYRTADVSSTVNVDHIKRHYYMSQVQLNPSGIVPAGPLNLFE